MNSQTFEVYSKENNNYVNLKNGIFSNSNKNSVSMGKKIFSLIPQDQDETFSKIKLTHKKEDSYAEIMKKINCMEELSHQLKFDHHMRRLNQEKEKIKIHKQNYKNLKSSPNTNQLKSFKLPKIRLNPIIIKDESEKTLLEKKLNLNESKQKVSNKELKENNFFKQPATITNKSIHSIKSERMMNSTKFLSNDSKLVNSYDSTNYKSHNDSQKLQLHLSYNSFDNMLTTDVNTINEINSKFSIAERNKREEIMSEDLVKKFYLNEFPETVKEKFKKFGSKSKQMRNEISSILTKFKKQEKTHNSILEITNKNFVFLYDINSRINIDKDDFRVKRKDDHAMNLNYYNAHRYGNIIKEKYHMVNINDSEELSKFIRIEKHKKVEVLLDKAEIKKKLLMKRIKIKNIK